VPSTIVIYIVASNYMRQAKRLLVSYGFIIIFFVGVAQFCWCCFSCSCCLPHLADAIYVKPTSLALCENMRKSSYQRIFPSPNIPSPSEPCCNTLALKRM